MELNLIEGLGLVAACLTTVSFVPQCWRIWKTRKVDDISLSMYLIFFTGVIFWLIYGLLIESLAVTLANLVTAVLVAIILGLKLKYRSK
ncbi:SemiSWEET family sugar transporter [Robertkochia flava]|uniref:SemiSWEET family sugar transporter n=1 Tax=Robertkochia flava TaxID=3447986 RepID=UPI001CCEF95F|nr:SemiSWEET transporter [Robertkochia marina]